ncbi:MAG: adenosylhomocysteinase [Actinomycetia bacterium]|nr:adenosylhomocysteinase [Actinomycetes bacterium]
MALLGVIGEEFAETKPFDGLRIGVSLHLEAKTAVLLETLQRGSATVIAAGNHGTSQDDVVAYLNARGIDARGSRFDDLETHLGVVASVVADEPDMLLDNGADLVSLVLENDVEVIGGTEETTSGHMRLDGEFRDRVNFPMIVINDSPLKAIAENQHAVGQSVYESFCRLTNLMPQGKRFLVVGYGWCGRGVAHYARANGAHVTVAEVDEIKMMEAALDGFRVGSVQELISHADVVITVTGAANVVDAVALAEAPSGLLLANAGHFPIEIDVSYLETNAEEQVQMGETITRYRMPDGRSIDLVADGRMMNLAGPLPKGNTIESMDLGVALALVGAACSGDDAGETLTTVVDAAPTTVTTADATATTTTLISFEPTDPSVMVNGGWLAYECRGEGAPAVVVDHGRANATQVERDPNWMLWGKTLDMIAETNKVCMYGRRGVVGSEPISGDPVRTTQDQVNDLNGLIDALELETPVILVGHSLGGFNIRLLAGQNPEKVAGLVFVDGTDTGIAEFGTAPSVSAPEWIDLVAGQTQAAVVTDLGDLPVYVLTATQVSSGRVWWFELQDNLLALSTNSVQMNVEAAHTNIHWTEPASVAEAVAWVTAQAG